MHFSLLVSVFDVDSKEGGAEDDPARGGDAQDRVHRRLHPGLLHLRGDQIWIEKSWLSFSPFWTSGPLEAWTCCWTLAMSLGYIWAWKHVLIFHFFSLSVKTSPLHVKSASHSRIFSYAPFLLPWIWIGYQPAANDRICFLVGKIIQQATKAFSITIQVHHIFRWYLIP